NLVQQGRFLLSQHWDKRTVPLNQTGLGQKNCPSERHEKEKAGYLQKDTPPFLSLSGFTR
ncbi:MAG: hypothetical protein K6B40_07670, partial [Firmicutes bacterium]|nr:hypothetical protein [Bacillota bacterium]